MDPVGTAASLPQEDVSRIYIADPTDHVEKGFAGLKDSRANLLAPFIAVSIDPCKSIQTSILA